MKKIIFVLSAAIFFASCKKDSSVAPDPTPGVTKKLMSYTYVYENNPAVTVEMTYDAQERLSVYKFQDYSVTFSYAGSKLNMVKKKLSDGQIEQYIECDLNEKGAVVKQVTKGPDNTVYDISEYTYDATGQMIKSKLTEDGDINEQVFTYANGNLVSSTVTKNAVLVRRHEYYYDENILNKGPFGINNYWSSEKLFGKTPKNMLIGSKSFDANNVVTSESNQVYELDVNGYPVKGISNYLPSAVKIVTTYTFQ